MEAKEFEHFKKVSSRFEELLAKVSNSYSAIEMSNIEREGVEVMRELQMCAPRLWEDFLAIVRERRRDIATGKVTPPVKQEQQPTVYCELPARKKKTKKAKK